MRVLAVVPGTGRCPGSCRPLNLTGGRSTARCWSGRCCCAAGACPPPMPSSIWPACRRRPPTPRTSACGRGWTGSTRTSWPSCSSTGRWCASPCCAPPSTWSPPATAWRCARCCNRSSSAASAATSAATWWEWTPRRSQRPRTFSELGKLLAERWPDRDPAALGNAVRAWVPLVQVPPRGIWGASGPAAHTTAEVWLGRPLERNPSPDGLVVRYLAAFGPASVKDLQTWSGLTRLREVTDRLRPGLRTFRDEHGGELLELPDAPRPDPDTPAPPRFLPEYDNLLLSHADRSRVVVDRRIVPLYPGNGGVRGELLVEGFWQANWAISRDGTGATLTIEPFRPLSKRDSAAVTREGLRLLAFAAAGAESHDVRINAAIGGRA